MKRSLVSLAPALTFGSVFSLPSPDWSRKYVYFTLIFFVALKRKEPGRAFRGKVFEWMENFYWKIKVLLCSFSGWWCVWDGKVSTLACLSVDVDRSRCKWFMRRNDRKELVKAKNGPTRISRVIFPCKSQHAATSVLEFLFFGECRWTCVWTHNLCIFALMTKEDENEKSSLINFPHCVSFRDEKVFFMLLLL